MELETFIELNFSDSQKSQVLKILEKYQGERQDMLDSLLEVRKHRGVKIAIRKKAPH